MLDKVDIECKVWVRDPDTHKEILDSGKINRSGVVIRSEFKGIKSGQAGAARLAISRALASFVSPEMVEDMRQGA